MRAVAILLLVAGCASASPAAPIVASPRPENAIVAPVATGPRPDDAALKARADAAVSATVAKLHDITKACAEQWIESHACEASAFEALASDYQAYYLEHPDPRREEGAMDALPRLGGPDAHVDQMTTDLARSCDDRCRSARVESLGTAVSEAVEECIKVKTGFAACKALEKKMAVNVRASEVERWTNTCEGRCEDHRADVRRTAEIDRRRPRTKAQADACRRTCEQKHGGGWCGTSLMGCLTQCTMLSEMTP